jgi:hypothetical protein
MVKDTPYDGEVKTVTELLEVIQSTGLLGLHHAHIRGWFRGQSDSSWELTPGVYRPNFNVSDEVSRLAKERHLTQDFRAMSAGLLASPISECDLYFVQQHYRMPTRLLDWTTNPLAALHFAVESHPNSDGAFVIVDAYKLGPDQRGKWRDGRAFEGVASSQSPLFEEALWPIFQWQDPEHFPSFILPVRPNQFDRRITLQRGCFTFHPPECGTLKKDVFRGLKAYCVPSASKPKLHQELALLGVDQFSIFGDLDHLAGHLKSAHRVG